MAVKIREKPKGSGIWWVFVNHNGLRRSKKIGKDKSLAQEVAKKLEAKLTLGDFNLEDKAIPTFKEYADNWISTTVPANCKPSTLDDYRSILRHHVIPAFGGKPVTEINRFDVKGFLMGKIKNGLASSTVGHMKSVVSGVLDMAVDDGVLLSNPTHRLGKLGKVKSVTEEIDPLTREETKTLLDTFTEEFPRHYPLALTLARTGVRFGEALALQWGDIDVKGRFLTVRRTFSKGNVVLPKSGKSRRVDMSKQLAAVLQDLQTQRKRETLRNGWGEIPEWVFINTTGGSLDGDIWRKRVFKKALQKAGLRNVRIHDLRHTYASLLIQAGESLAYARDQMGHYSIRVTVDTYGHLAPGGNKDAVDRLDDDAPKRTLYAPKNDEGVSDFR